LLTTLVIAARLAAVRLDAADRAILTLTHHQNREPTHRGGWVGAHAAFGSLSLSRLGAGDLWALQQALPLPQQGRRLPHHPSTPSRLP
jgi:hypothetical protein